jgi:hypothetical protein
VLPVWRGRAKPATRSFINLGCGLLPIRATFERPLQGHEPLCAGDLRLMAHVFSLHRRPAYCCKLDVGDGGEDER